MVERPTVYVPGLRKPRKGRGYSLGELREAGITPKVAERLRIPMDRKRKSNHIENIERLKQYLRSLEKE